MASQKSVGRLRKREAVLLDPATVARATKEAKPYTIFDSDVKGFGLRVFPTGAKSYVLEYRPAGKGRTAGKSRLKLGASGSMSPAAARKAARDHLAKVHAAGADPMRERREAREAVTLDEAAEQFFEDRKDGKKPLKASTLAEYERQYERHIKPALGARPLASVTGNDAARLHAALVRKTSAGQEIGKTQANRVVALLGSIWGWSSKAPRMWVERDKSPARTIERNAETKRERYLSSAEVARLGEVLEQAVEPGLPWRPLTRDLDARRARHRVTEPNRRTKFPPETVAAIKLIMLTGARRGEVLELKWEYVKPNRLELPDSKTGAKTIRLSGAAVAVLDGLRERAAEGAEYVFAGKGETGHVGNIKRLWAAVTRVAGLAGLHLHDLRHSFASHALGAGLSLEIIGGLLGHRSTQTTKRYAHLLDETAEAATDAIGARFDAILRRP